jgi:hypothetical protein
VSADMKMEMVVFWGSADKVDKKMVFEDEML